MNQMTGATPNPSPTGLVVPSLVNMANKGFDVPCLAAMQSQALRRAAQLVQHRQSAGKTTRPEDLRVMVDKLLAGEQFGGRSGEVTQAHIAGYMQTRQMLSQAAPGNMLIEAEALATLDLPPDVYGKEPQLQVTNWLARHLNSLRQYADQLEQATPLFAASIRNRVATIEQSYCDPKGLQLMYGVLDEIAQEALRDLDDDSDNLHYN